MYEKLGTITLMKICNHLLLVIFIACRFQTYLTLQGNLDLSTITLELFIDLYKTNLVYDFLYCHVFFWHDEEICEVRVSFPCSVHMQ